MAPVLPRLVFATHNAHKVAEIRKVLGDALQIQTLTEAGILDEIPEPHDSLEANASEKSQTIFRLTGQHCFSEDTGLEVAALGGEPGVKSARYAGEERDFAANTQKVLKGLAGNSNRSARFRTVVSLIWEGKEHLFEGICEGHILEKPVGNAGFGYDPIFCPLGSTLSFAQMSTADKNQYSHRRKAMEKALAFLQNQTMETPTS